MANTSSHEKVLISDLPVEVLKNTFSYLDPASYFYVAQVCHVCRSVALDKNNLIDHIMDTGLDEILSPLHPNSQIRQHLGLATTPDEATQSKILMSRSWMRQLYATKARDCIVGKILTKVMSSSCLFNRYLTLLRLKLKLFKLSPTYLLYINSSPTNLQTGNTLVFHCSALSPDGTKMITCYGSTDSSCETNTPLKDHEFVMNIFSLTSQLENNSLSNKQRLEYSLRVAKSDRLAQVIAMSTDNKFIAVTYKYGYVEVYKLPGFSVNSSSSQYTYIKPIFEKQYPSSISYLGISQNGEVLFIRSKRLGGLLLVNLRTKVEMDIPHYRLDLNMSLQLNDRILSISGWKESIIFGSAHETQNSITSPSSPDSNAQQKDNSYILSPPSSHEDNFNYISGDDDEEDSCCNRKTKRRRLADISDRPKFNVDSPPDSLWDYYSNLITSNTSSYVPAENVMALSVNDMYLGFVREDQFKAKLVLFKLVDEPMDTNSAYEEYLGMAATQHLIMENQQSGNENATSDNENRDDEDENNTQLESENTTHGLNNEDYNNEEDEEGNDYVANEEGNDYDEDDEDDGGDDDDDDDEEGQMKRTMMICTFNGIVYCLSNSTRLFAILTTDTLFIYHFNLDVMEETLKCPQSPCPYVPFSVPRSYLIKNLEEIKSKRKMGLMDDQDQFALILQPDPIPNSELFMHFIGDSKLIILHEEQALICELAQLHNNTGPLVFEELILH